MPRIRTVKPEFWTDSKVVALSMPARLMFIGAWNYADDYGCLPSDALQLKLRVLPADQIDADEMVAELLDSGLLEVMVTADGEQFWHVTHWDRHQKVSHPKDSDFGAPETWRRVNSGADAISPEDSGGFMGEGSGREGNTHPTGSDGALFSAFYEFWMGKPYTKNGISSLERGRINKAVKLAKTDGITPEEVTSRGERYRKQWSALERTPQALLANWSRFEPESEPVPCDTCENRGRVGFTEFGVPTSMDDPAAVDYGLCPSCHPKGVRA